MYWQAFRQAGASENTRKKKLFPSLSHKLTQKSCGRHFLFWHFLRWHALDISVFPSLLCSVLSLSNAQIARAVSILNFFLPPTQATQLLLRYTSHLCPLPSAPTLSFALWASPPPCTWARLCKFCQAWNRSFPFLLFFGHPSFCMFFFASFPSFLDRGMPHSGTHYRVPLLCPSKRC